MNPTKCVSYGILLGIGFAIVNVLFNCGGGNSSSLSQPQTVSPTPQSPKSLTYAYYGSVSGMTDQVRDHVNAIMIPPWVDDQVPFFREAGDLKIIWYPKPTPDIYQQAVYLDSLGLLKNIIAVYPCDEPDINPCLNPADVRRIMGLFPALASAKLAVIYAGRYPGIENYDWVGVDDYSQGAAVLRTKVADLRSQLGPDQKLILVPGGADPWRTDPKPFFDYALSDDKVAMIMPFVWFDRGTDKGIGTNGMADQYKAVGKAIK